MPTALTTTDLFTPAPSGVGAFGNVPAVPVSDTWLGKMLTIAATVRLPTTSWESGAPERTILAIQAVTFAESDVDVSLMAQGGFLQSAASGYVISYGLDGTQTVIPVTPDPSDAAANPTGAPGWLDLLTQATYDVTRLAATRATGPLAIANLSGGTKGPYPAGAYHVSNGATGATYANLASLTVPSSVIAGNGGLVSTVATGPAYSTITTIYPHGLSPGASVYVAIPASSGVTGLQSVFATVTAVTSNGLQIAVPSSGATTSSVGQVYLCTVASMQADAIGPSGNAAPGAVSTTVTQAAGVSCSNVSAWSAANWESNAALVARTLLSLASRSPNGPSQAYVYTAQTAAPLLATQVPPYALTNGPVSAAAFGDPQTGVETIVVASLSPASTVLGAHVTPGVSQLPIAAITNASPCHVTCTGPTSLAAGQSMAVTIDGAVGIAGVNGTFLGTYVNASTFSIPIDTTSAGTWIGGGQVEGGDLGAIDGLIQARVTPDNTTAITVSALALPIAVIATVSVPQAYVAAYKARVGPQLQAQIDSYAVGGSSASTPANSVPFDDIIAALEEAGVQAIGQASYVKGVNTLSVNGLTTAGSGVAFPSNLYKAILLPLVVTVLGV